MMPVRWALTPLYAGNRRDYLLSHPMPLEVITGPGAPRTQLPFSPAVRAGGFVFVSGQASTDEQGNLAPDTFENEMRRTMGHLQAVLAAAGLTLRDVVQVRGYVTDQADLPEYNRIYREYFAEPYPARTTIVRCLGRVKVEIDAIAYAGGGRDAR
jgi:2-iminobutanoate/2-iminopropanoate deaminase